MDMAMVWSMVRDLLMLSPRPRLILTTDTDWDSDTPLLDMGMDSDMAMDSSTARGLLMLRPIPTTPPTALDTPDTSDTPDTADTTTASRLYQDLSVNQQLEFRQKWIVISLKFPSPVLQFQCYHTKSLVMVCRKQENQIDRNPTNIEISKKKKK